MSWTLALLGALGGAAGSLLQITRDGIIELPEYEGKRLKLNDAQSFATSVGSGAVAGFFAAGTMQAAGLIGFSVGVGSVQLSDIIKSKIPARK